MHRRGTGGKEHLLIPAGEEEFGAANGKVPIPIYADKVVIAGTCAGSCCSILQGQYFPMSVYNHVWMCITSVAGSSHKQPPKFMHLMVSCDVAASFTSALFVHVYRNPSALEGISHLPLSRQVTDVSTMDCETLMKPDWPMAL